MKRLAVMLILAVLFVAPANAEASKDRRRADNSARLAGVNEIAHGCWALSMARAWRYGWIIFWV